MSKWTRLFTVAAIVPVLASTGCATKAQLRRGLEAEAAAREALAAEHARALEAGLGTERAAREADDRRLAADLGNLNTDLAGLRDEHGVRIAQLEDGMEFVVPVHFAFNAAQL